LEGAQYKLLIDRLIGPLILRRIARGVSWKVLDRLGTSCLKKDTSIDHPGDMVAVTFALPIAECSQGMLSTTTVQAVISVESGGNVLAIHVNNATFAVPTPVDADDAAGIAARFIKMGYSVDLGLMQVNSGNLASLGYTVREMFDACPNITAGTIVLSHAYDAALRALKVGPDALQAALSAYNTGNFWGGLSNGYVARYDISGGIDDVMPMPAGGGMIVNRGGLLLRLGPQSDFITLGRPNIALGWQRVFLGADRYAVTAHYDAAAFPRPTVRLTDASIFRVSLDLSPHARRRGSASKHRRDTQLP
jgi:Transglycosylase SLT domain